MSNTKKIPGKNSVLIYVAIAFIAGFLCGAGFAVYKIGGNDTPTASTPQANITDQQSQAMAHLEEEVTSNPENFQAWTQLANLYFDSGQYQKAVKAYEASLDLHAGNANIWTDLGVMYRRTKQPQRAIEAFDKAIAMDPMHETSRLNKGIVLLYDQNDVKGAIAAWENLLKINPEATTTNGDSIRDFIAQLRANEGKDGN